MGHRSESETQARFFAAIRSYFTMQPDGRYFAVLLRELALREPDSFCALLDLLKKKDDGWKGWDSLQKQLLSCQLTLTREYEYYRPHGKSKGKVADLALSENGSKSARVLFEIKEFDGKGKENPKQIKRYIKQLSEDSAFVFVSRFAPEPGVQCKLDEGGKGHVVALRYYEIYEALKQLKARVAPVARMIVEYMDINVVGYRMIDLKKDKANINYLLTQLLGSRDGKGRNVSAAAASAAPDIISRLHGNLETLGDWIRLTNRNLIPTRFKRTFTIEPAFNIEKLRKKLKTMKDNDLDELPGGIGKYVEGGTVYFCGWGSLKQKLGAWMYVEIGYALDIHKARKGKQCGIWLYTSFYGSGLKEEASEQSTKYLKGFPDEESAREQFRSLLRTSLRKARKNAKGKAKTALQSFKLPYVVQN